MKSIFFLAIIICIGHQLKANQFMQNDTTGNNQLTKKEQASGWQLLFDGKTMNGWRTFKNEKGFDDWVLVLISHN